jgi:hypothetical protein
MLGDNESQQFRTLRVEFLALEGNGVRRRKKDQKDNKLDEYAIKAGCFQRWFHMLQIPILACD